MTEQPLYDEELEEESEEELDDEFDDFDDDFDDGAPEEGAQEEGEPHLLHEPVPVDMKKEEYISYTMAVARQFGALRMQKMSAIMFIGYLVIIGGSLIAFYLETHVWDWMMLVLLLVTLLSTAVIFTLVPYRVKKTAISGYEAGNLDEYYGELIVTPQAIIKKSNDGEVVIPLNERTMYLEDRGFMAFTTQGVVRGIVLPARCVTPSLAAAIRKAVFAGRCFSRKRVIRPMQPLATAPIERREGAPKAEPIVEVRVRYEAEEVQKMITDSGWHNYVQSLPIIVTLGVMLGTIMAMMEENLPVFFVSLVGTVLVMFLLSMLGTRSKAKQAAMMPQQASALTVELNKYGVVMVQHTHNADAPENRVLTRWNCLTRAVERPECVDITSDGRMIRIPKRCILDLEEFRNVVDAYYPPKSKS